MTPLQARIEAIADEAIRAALITLGGELRIMATSDLADPATCLDMAQRLRAVREVTDDDVSRDILGRALDALGVAP